jgi:4-hydroxybenzoate polyprenyltransferase
MLTGKFLSIEIFIAGWFWTMAMHAFSAIPDIEADKKASVDTIATFLGKNGTLYFCLVSFTLSAIFAFSTIGLVSIVLGIVYVLIIAAALLANDSARLFQIYRIFPFVNTVNGFILFWIAAAKFL